MKKILSIVLIILLLFSFASCEDNEVVEETANENIEEEQIEKDNKEEDKVEEDIKEEKEVEETVKLDFPKINKDYFKKEDLENLNIEDIPDYEYVFRPLIRNSKYVLVSLDTSERKDIASDLIQFVINLDGEMVSDVLEETVLDENITRDGKILVSKSEENYFVDFYNNRLTDENINIEEILESYDRRKYIIKGEDKETKEKLVLNSDLKEIYRYEDGEEILFSPMGLYVNSGDEEFLITSKGTRLDIDLKKENRTEPKFFGRDEELLLIASKTPSEKEGASSDYTARLYDLRSEEYIDINWENEDYLFFELLPYSINYADIIITPQSPDDETKYRYSIINGDLSEFEIPIAYEVLTDYPELRFIGPAGENEQAIYHISEDGEPLELSERYTYLGSGRVSGRNEMPQFYNEDSVLAFNEPDNIWYILDSEGNMIIDGSYGIRMFIPDDNSFYTDYSSVVDEDGEEKLKLNIDDRFFINSNFEKLSDDDLEEIIEKSSFLVLEKLK